MVRLCLGRCRCSNALLLFFIQHNVALAAKGCLGLQDCLKQAPSHTETAACKPETAAGHDERNVGALDDDVFGCLAVGIAGEQRVVFGVVDLNALPLAVVEWQLDLERGVLAEIGLTGLRVLGVVEHGREDGADDLSGHGLAEPFLGVGDGIALDLGLKLLHCCKELADLCGLVLVAGELERHGVGLDLAGLLVSVLIHAPGEHERSLNVEHGIGRSIEDADALAAGIVDFDFCVFGVGFNIEICARDDLRSGFGFSGHCVVVVGFDCRVGLVWWWLLFVNCLPFLCPNL